MYIISLSAILLALCLTANASAIKNGHAKASTEDAAQARSVKSAPVEQQKFAAKGQAQPVQAPVAILESTKRIYNDESIRRLIQAAPPMPDQVVAKPIVEEPVAPKQHVQPVPVAPAAPVKPVEQVVVAAPAVQPIAVAAPVQPVVVPAPAPVAPVVAAPVQPVVQPAVVEPKSALQPEPVVAKPKEEKVPEPSERSAVVVEQVVKVPEKQPMVAQAQPVAAPVVVAVAQPVAPAQEESALQAKKDEPAVAGAAAPSPVEAPIEVPAPDPGLVLSEPIDSTTKLLIDLDEHVQKFLPVEEQQASAAQAQAQKDQVVLVPGIDYSPAQQQAAAAASPTGKSSGPLVPYASVSGSDDSIVPPLPALDGVEKASASGGSASPSAPASGSSSGAPVAAGSSSSQSSATRQGGHSHNHNHQQQQQVINQLMDQLDSLQNRITDTINQLVARRRYVMSALLRPMGTYVRRVRTNLERLQNRVNQLQSAASSVGGGGSRPGGFVDAAAIETIRKRIEDISKRISDIVNRIRFSLTPTSAPLNSNGRR